eukprot:8984731-Lingulodinium_polyedra.AAC.1
MGSPRPGDRGVGGARPVARELLPCPLPFPEAAVARATPDVCRSVRARLHRKLAWQRWANDGVQALSE